ncbi:MAG: prepilin-type N-terminal cleavage/methylation domain-containing protein [Candidatus Omnitrophota bacterium]|jgi:prepilin-type N-terminal cleavage/methylation domain-containing protein
MRNKRKYPAPGGFTLLEVLVALVLIVIGISAATAAISTGKFFLKQAEDKARAMRVALVKMEEYLAKPYSSLRTGESIAGNTGKINWQVNITQRYEEGNAAHIPYKHIESVAFYNETDKSGNVYHKSIRLENIVPYPFIHTNSTNYPSSESYRPHTIRLSREKAENSQAPYSSNPGNFVNATVIGNPQDTSAQLKVKATPEVTKDCLIIYNVATGIEDSSGVTESNTTYTGCFVDGIGPYPVVTRTPIISQPLISNVVALTEDNALTPNSEHTIEIRWCKDTPKGKVSLVEGELMVVLLEKTQ